MRAGPAVALALSALLPAAAAAAGAGPEPPTAVSIDPSGAAEQKLVKFWQASVGSGHAALGVPGAIPTTIPLAPGSSLGQMWREQLKAVHDDTGIYGVRFHGTFSRRRDCHFAVTSPSLLKNLMKGGGGAAE